MKFFLALCFVAAVAQAHDIDWDNVITPDVFPEGLLDEIVNSGISPRDDFSRITNGNEAKPGQFPYQVAVISQFGDSSAFCGGSILNSQWILTAAHCVDSATSSTVRVGAHKVQDATEKGQFTIKASKIIIHAKWNPNLLSNDIALLKLESPIEFSDHVQSVRLPSRSQVGTTFAGETATVSGWGLDSDKATAISPVLRYVSNPILKAKRCNIWYLGAVGDKQICLAGTGGRSSCSGDSGGPLVITEKDGSVTQIGLVSFGIKFGCSIGWPGVYTRTSEFLDWIVENTESSVTIRN